MTTTTTSKAQAKRDEIAHNVELLSDIKAGDTLYTETSYTGNMGTAYVRVFRVNDAGNTAKIENITYHIGKATAQSLRERGGRWVIHTGGGGYSRGQHVVDALSWALFGKNGQLKDREL